MSAWGVKPFENDEALDGLEDALEGSLEGWLAAVEADLRKDKVLTTEDGCAVIAVSAILVGFRPEGQDETVWNAFYNKTNIKQIRRVKKLLKLTIKPSRSEVYQLWEQSKEFDGWLANVKNLLIQLR